MHLDESEKKNQNEKDVEYSFLEGEAALVEEAQYKYGNPPEKKQGEYTLEDYYAPHMYPLQGKVGLALYDDELLIDLDTIADLIVDDLP